MISEAHNKKKRSFLGRLFSRTLKLNKKPQLHKHDNKVPYVDSTIDSTKSLIDKEDGRLFTFCDYCNEPVLTSNISDRIVCHIKCRENSLTVLKLNDTIDTEYNSATFTNITNVNNNNSNFNESSDFEERFTKSSDSYRSNTVKEMPSLTNRWSASLSDISIGSSADTATVTSKEYNCNDSTIKLNQSHQFPETSNRATGNHRDSIVSFDSLQCYTISSIDTQSLQSSGIKVKRLETSIISQSQLSTDLQHFLAPPGVTPPIVYDNRCSVSSSTEQSSNLCSLPNPLRAIVEIFNTNDQGLWLEFSNNQLMGRLRIYINLLRPIKMLMTARPPSIYDTLSPRQPDQDTIDRAYYKRESIFWLPRGTTKLLYINVNSKTSDVINQLLQKFNISNNPKKFALYEHRIVSDTNELYFRKLKLYECPLKIILNWCEQGSDTYHYNLRNTRFVLQENDPGSIDWDEFSLPELKSFLGILNTEESDKKQLILKKYEILRGELQRLVMISSHTKNSKFRTAPPATATASKY